MNSHGSRIVSHSLLASALLLIGSLPVARATVTFEFQLGSVPLPGNSLGVLVVDVAGDGFTSPSDSMGTVLSPGVAMGGGDDVIVSVFPVTSADPFAPDAGFAELVGPIDYEALGVAEGQALNFFVIPGRSPGGVIRTGETFVSYRTDDQGDLIGDMGFALPRDGGSYVLGAITLGLGGGADFAGLLPETPLIGIDDQDDLIVGKEFVLQVEASGDPLRYIIRGLPPGLRYDPSTGLVTGRFIRPGSFAMRVWVRNVTGISGPITVPLEVAALPDAVIGNFQGLVDRDADLNESLGGRLVLRTARNGLLTGRLILGRRGYGFRSYLKTDMASGVPVDPVAEIQINRRGMPPKDVRLTFDLDAESFSGSVREGTVEAEASGYHHGWHPSRNRPEGYEGYYTNLLDLDPAQGLAGDPDVPQGNGFAGLTVLRSGVARWVGRMGDGTPMSFAGTLGPEGQYHLFRILYGNTGSVLGVGAIQSDPGNDGDFDDNTVDGTWDWVKSPQANPRLRNYRDGFGFPDPVRQVVVGERWLSPARGDIPVGLPDTADNVRLQFFEGGIDDAEMDPGVVFQLSAGPRGLTPTDGDVDNPARTNFFLNRRTGLMRGAFLLLDTNPDSSRPFQRRVSYQGMVVPSRQIGAGYFLLGQLPDDTAEPATTLRTAPVLSGQVILEENAP